MATNEYHFITHWRVKASVQEVTDIIADAESLPRWWPSVYLEVQVLEKGDAQGIGKRGLALYQRLAALYAALAISCECMRRQTGLRCWRKGILSGEAFGPLRKMASGSTLPTTGRSRRRKRCSNSSPSLSSRSFR